jgi:mycothiol synthase
VCSGRRVLDHFAGGSYRGAVQVGMRLEAFWAQVRHSAVVPGHPGQRGQDRIELRRVGDMPLGDLVREQSDQLLAELYIAQAPLHAEATPDDPRLPLAAEIADVRHLPAPEDGVVLVARDAAARIAGLASVHWEDLAGWAHVLWTSIAVLPECRRQGLGTLLLRRSAAIAQQRGLRLMMSRTKDNVPSGAAFCAQFGAEQAMVEQENRLDLRGVDQDLVAGWIADGQVRAAGYRLEFVAGRTPPELAAHVAEVMSVMNSAPRENMDVSDTPVTTELVHQYEDAWLAAGRQLWAYYAVEESTGRFVGLSTISIRPDVPDRVWVGDTAVEPSHRGRGLGKWLKAAMTRRILDELPDVRYVITRNAGSNEPMLAINTRLGFRAAAVWTTWQAATNAILGAFRNPCACHTGVK